MPVRIHQRASPGHWKWKCRLRTFWTLDVGQHFLKLRIQSSFTHRHPNNPLLGHVSCLESRVDIAEWRRWHGRDVMDTKETVLRWCSKAFLGKVWLRWSRNCWQKFLAWIRRWRKLMSSGWGQHFDIVWVCKFGCLGRIMNCSWRVCQLHPSKNLQNPQVCNVNSWVKEDATKQKGSCRLLVKLCKYIYIHRCM